MGKKKEKLKKIVTVLCMLAVLFAIGTYIRISYKVIDDTDTPLASNVPVAMSQLIKNPSSINALETCDFSFNNWISGNYRGSKGSYAANAKELCLSEYKSINSSSYKVEFSDAYFYMLIAEFDEKGNFIANNFAVNGMTYKPKASVKYVGIGIYNYKQNRTMTYAGYKELFNKGNTFKLISNDPVKVELPKEEIKEEPKEEPKEEIKEELKEENIPNEEQEEQVEEMVPSFTTSVAPTPEPVEKTAADLLREELIQMVTTGDMTTHKVTSYKISQNDALAVWKDLAKTDLHMYIDTDGIFFVYGLDVNKNITSILLYGMDEDFINRHNRMMKVIDELCSKVDDKMTDLDKVVLVHEYLVKNTIYNKNALHAGSAAEILGNSTGVCAGYAQAMTIILEKMGVKSVSVTSSAMNHEWNYVEIDGEVYHIDNCWDNTKQTKATGQYWHRYLLRNDAEMKTITPTHYSFSHIPDKSIVSTSTKFSKWFVHDVYGEMFYYKGLWYYYDKTTNSIKASDIYGKTQTTLVSGGSGTLKLTKLENGVLSYSLAGINKSYTIK